MLPNSWSAPKIDVKTAILLDYNSDEILFELEPDMEIYPASMTKIMTSIIAFDLLKQGKIKLDDEVIVSENAWRLSSAGYSSMFIMLNDKVTIEDLLKGIIIVSGNDACVALAEAIAGTESNFAEMMTEKAVEIGMNNKGEIAPLSLMSAPHITLITSLGEAHLGNLLSLENIMLEKATICAGLKPGSICVIPSDTKLSKKLSKAVTKKGIKAISFGRENRPDFILKDVRVAKNITCARMNTPNGLESYFKVNSPGIHHATNAVGVIAILESLDLDTARGIMKLASWVPSSGRGLVTEIEIEGQTYTGILTVIDETYNANPQSVGAAIDLLSKFDSDQFRAQIPRQRKIAILGDMLELGSKEDEMHSALIDTLNLAYVDKIHCVGMRMRSFYNVLPLTKKGEWFKCVDEITPIVNKLVNIGDVVMLKASHSVGLSKVVDSLKSKGRLLESKI